MKYKLFHPYLVALIFAAGHLASPVSTHLDRERYEHLVNRAPPRESEHPGPPREWWMQIVDANTKRIQVLEAEYKKNTKRMKEAHVPSVATEWRRALQFNEREREFFKAENDRIKTCALRSPSDTIMSLTASIVLFHDRIHFVEDQRLMQQTDVSDRSSGNDYWRKAPKNHAKDIEEAKSLIQNAQILSASNPPNTIDSSPSHRSASEKQPLLQGHVDSSSHKFRNPKIYDLEANMPLACGTVKNTCKVVGSWIKNNYNPLLATGLAYGATVTAACTGPHNPGTLAGACAVCGFLWCDAIVNWAKVYRDKKNRPRDHSRYISEFSK